MSDLHVDLTLKLHLINNYFQTSNFRYSLEYIAKGDTYLTTAWKQEWVFHQAASLKVTSIRHQNDIEKNTWKTHQYFIDFESRIDVELSASNQCHSFHVDSLFTVDEISTDFRGWISILNRQRTDEDVSIVSLERVLLVCSKFTGKTS